MEKNMENEKIPMLDNRKKGLSQEEMIDEIVALRSSPYYKLYKSMENSKLRQKLYQMRYYEKKGREIAKRLGIAFDDDGEWYSTEEENNDNE